MRAGTLVVAYFTYKYMHVCIVRVGVMCVILSRVCLCVCAKACTYEF